MAGVNVAHTINDFKQYLNDKNLVEIVLRDKNQRFRAFQNVALEQLQQNEVSEQIQKAINLLNQSNSLTIRCVSNSD